ncbi:FtsK/SpoIIIE domain-containing protein [Streptomyces sp. ST2-7A]|uniref:FtsK/SpoIIIE domain-containing protein n=1 Tax=Streptomyces sp. ST2-7A TaxID=2907214 RepID=UPI001F1A87DD|nr:FtsK/SpoIIIE domain-containing protein [Streptomyces sp. ST2-7A]MCE7082394.1 FHA domain-containing protein [Streptomyces sp. ST2-7A]
MQIRLTVLGPRGGEGADVTVTAPVDTPLEAVLGDLVAAADPAGGVPGVVWCGARRLDPRRAPLGRPPLMDGAVLATDGPVGVDRADDSVPRLLVVSGPDAGGVHLLHGGEVRIGRSARADVPLDDPDVSRLHCLLTVPDGPGPVTARDLCSTNGTTLEGVALPTDRDLPLPPGSELRLGESTLRILAARGADPATEGAGSAPVPPPEPPPVPAAETPRRRLGGRLLRRERPPEPSAPPAEAGARTPRPAEEGAGPDPAELLLRALDDPAGLWPAAPAPRRKTPPPAASRPAPRARSGSDAIPEPAAPSAPAVSRTPGGPTPWAGAVPTGSTPAPSFPFAPDLPTGAVPRARTRPEHPTGPAPVAPRPDTGGAPTPAGASTPPAPRPPLIVRPGTVHRSGGGREPVAVSLEAIGSLGLVGPRRRLSGLARGLIARLIAEHPPAALELVVVAPDRAAEWAWTGWLPHTAPGPGRACRRLVAFDREQALARLRELGERESGERDPDGPRTLLVLDGDPGGAEARAAAAELVARGRARGVHALCLAEAPAATPASPLERGLASARAAVPALVGCGSTAVLVGEVATTVRLVSADGTVGPAAAVDAVSSAWAERFARALAPLGGDPDEPDEATTGGPLPSSVRLLDLLGLPRVTPGVLRERWSTPRAGLPVPLGVGTGGPVVLDPAALSGPLVVEGPPGSGRSETLCSLVVALAAARGPRELSLLLVEGGGGGRLAACAELPQTASRLRANDPVRMRAFARALRAELKRREDLLDGRGFAEDRPGGGRTGFTVPEPPEEDGVPLPTMLAPGSGPLPRLMVVVDDSEALWAPAAGDPGRPAAGSMVRILEAVAGAGARLGVHLILAGGPARAPGARVRLAGSPAGRGELLRPGAEPVELQVARVTGRIPRTSTLRPTVVPLDWDRAGDPPTRRPVRELGNGPTDAALLASAAARAGRNEHAASPV